MDYSITILAVALRELEALPSRICSRIREKIEDLSTNPRSPGVKKLSGSDDLYRIRIGDYRVIYEIRDRELVVVVVRVGHRRDVYR